MRKLLNPNNVSGVSQAMGVAAMRDQAHMRDIVARGRRLRRCVPPDQAYGAQTPHQFGADQPVHQDGQEKCGDHGAERDEDRDLVDLASPLLLDEDVSVLSLKLDNCPLLKPLMRMPHHL